MCARIFEAQGSDQDVVLGCNFYPLCSKLVCVLGGSGLFFLLGHSPQGTVCRVCSVDVMGSGLELLASRWFQLLPGAHRSLLCVYHPSPSELPVLALSFWCLPALHSPELSATKLGKSASPSKLNPLGTHGTGAIRNCVLTAGPTDPERYTQERQS